MQELGLLSAFFAGFFASGHCLGMCGGISAALSAQSPRRQPMRNLLIYNTGRLTTYLALGLLVGGLSESALSLFPSLALPLRMLAGGLLIALGLYLSETWLGLSKIEALGQSLWRHLQPLSKKCLPIDKARHAFALGLLWGFLPCGLIYSTLAITSTTGSALTSASLMLAFGLGTLPAMLSAACFSEQLLAYLKQKKYKRLVAFSVITMGILTVFVPLQHSQHGSHAQHNHANSLPSNTIDITENDARKSI